MKTPNFDEESKYQTVMAVFRTMLEKGIIDKSDYTIIDTKMKEKYEPFLGSI